MTVVRSDRSGLIIDLNSEMKLLSDVVKSDGCADVGVDLGLVSEAMLA